jgi:Ca-activated chloride channel family protein
MNLQFANGWMLYLLWLVPLVSAGWAWLDNRNRQALDNLVGEKLRKRLAPPDMQSRKTWQLVLVSAGVLFLLLAGARPQWGEREETLISRGRDVVIAVDVSRSMLAPDVHPNRLGRAKADLIDLIRDLNGDRAAIVAFRKTPRTVCPFTTDYAFLKQAIDGLGTYSAPRGETDIGAAIVHALSMLDTDALSHQAIVLISDGEDLSGEAIQAATEAGKRGIPIYTVGIGSRKGSKIPDKESQSGYLRDGERDAVSKLNDSTLHAISEASAGGAYIPLGTAGTANTTLGQLYRKRLANIQAHDMAESQRRRAIDRFQWFLGPALIFLLAAAALSRGRLAVRRTQKTATSFAALFLLLLPISLHAQQQAPEGTPATPTATNNTPAAEVDRTEASVTDQIPNADELVGHWAAWEAQKLAKSGKHAAAAKLYEQAAQGVSEAAARTFLQNAAAAYYRAGDLERTEQLLTQLAATPTNKERPQTLEALGGVLSDVAEATSVTNAATAKQRAEILQRAGNAIGEAAKQTDDAKAKRDLAAILNRWSEARSDAQKREIEETYGETKLPDLMNQLLQQQRDIRRQAYAQATNNTPSRVAALENLAESQRQLSRAWSPLQQKLSEALQQSTTNAQQAAAMLQFAEQSGDMARKTANMLRDLDPEAAAAARQNEEATYQLWKPAASFENLFSEQFYRQTNAISMTADAAANKPIDYQQLQYDQKEAGDLTKLFRSRFEQAIPEEGNLQVVTNMVDGTPTITTNGISAEARAEILGLSDLLEEAQKNCTGAIGKREFKKAQTQQKECLDAANRISELLPKPPPQQQQQNQQQNQNDQQQQQQNQNDQQQQQQNQDQDQDQQDQDQQNAQEQQQEDEQQASQQRKERDAETLLERALEREREYEERKRERDRYMPMLPGQRDL